MARHMEPSLYAPQAYRATDPAAIVRRYPFALLVSQSPGGLSATSIPIYFETDESERTMVGHLARNNPHAAALHDGMSVLAVFSGPHAYISSRWYRDKPQVPTWNYVAAQVRGTVEPIDDEEGQLAVLRRTVMFMERGHENPWSMEQAPDGRVAQLLPMIRSFRLTVERIDGVTKLNQTHPAADRLNVIEHLLESGDGNDAEIARLMAALGLD